MYEYANFGVVRVYFQCASVYVYLLPYMNYSGSCLTARKCSRVFLVQTNGSEFLATVGFEEKNMLNYGIV